MAQLSQPFDPRSVAPAMAEGGGVKLTVGKWPMMVVADEIKPTKDDPNQAFIELTVELLDGPEKSLQAKMRFNIYNNNPQAREIAYRMLTSLCYVVGHFAPLQDLSVLHRKPFIGVVTPQRNDAERTEISGVLDQQGNDPGKGAQQQPQQQQQQPYNPTQGVSAPQGGPGTFNGGAPQGGPQGGPPAGGAWGGAAPAQQQTAAQAAGPQGGAAGWGGAAPATQQQQPAAGGNGGWGAPAGGAAPAAGGAPPWGGAR